MRESERKRLLEILKQNCHCINEDCEKCSSNGICFTHREADHLLDNGIVVPPVKVGDVVWLIGNMRIYTKEVICSRKVISVQRLRTGETLMHFKDGCFPSDAIGVYAFTSREEAEKALRKEDEGK